MKAQGADIRLWLWGLAAFAVVILLSLAITWGGASWGIGAHQAAGTADRVEAIQRDWREAGVRPLAIVAMVGDLVFIGIYGWGSWRAGRGFAAQGGAIGMVGWLVAGAAVVFLITDYTETLLELVQLLRERGSDWMAGTAAAVRPIKSIAWLATFFGVLIALGLHRFAARSA